MGFNFKKNIKGGADKPRIEVQSKSTYSAFLPREVPNELKGDQYNIQAFLGLIGIAFVFLSFKNMSFMFIGLLCIYGKGAWRKKTDFAAKNHQDAVNFYKTRKYQQCIEAIDKVFTHPKAQLDLYLAKAECFLELDNMDQAFTAYKKYFEKVDPSNLSPLDYWSPKANAIGIAVDEKDYNFALKIIETLPDQTMQDIDFPLWKNYYKGLCFLGQKQYEAAYQTFKNAIGPKKRMEEPYIDCHYYMAIAYTKLGKMNLAHQKFQVVYGANKKYKNIAAIIDAISSGKEINHLIENI